MTIDRMGSLDPLKNVSKPDKLSKAPQSSRTDSIEVSREAKAQAELLAVKDAVQNSPEIRMDRVEDVKLKLQDPNYINNTVLDSTADNILKSFGL